MSDQQTETETAVPKQSELIESLDRYHRAREAGDPDQIEETLKNAAELYAKRAAQIDQQGDTDEQTTDDATEREASTSAVRFVVRTLPDGELEFGKIESEASGRIEFEVIDYLSGELRKTDEICEAPASQCRTFDDADTAYAFLRHAGGEQLQTRLPTHIAIYRTGSLHR